MKPPLVFDSIQKAIVQLSGLIRICFYIFESTGQISGKRPFVNKCLEALALKQACATASDFESDFWLRQKNIFSW